LNLLAPLRRIEEGALVAALGLATVVPLVDFLGRPLGGLHLPGGAGLTQQLTLWLAFVGGLVATRERQHLTLSTAEVLGQSGWKRAARLVAASVSAAVVAVLAYASAELVAANREQGKILIAGIPQWWSECIMPAALAFMAVRFAWSASEGWRGRLVAVAAVALAFSLGLAPAQAACATWLLAVLVLLSALLGTPSWRGRLALYFFFRTRPSPRSRPDLACRLAHALPAIPVTAWIRPGRSSRLSRLVRFFRASWLDAAAAGDGVACARSSPRSPAARVTIIASADSSPAQDDSRSVS
jgi:TRAP-type C4-dicarboxylate transport system permease small subunit